MADVPRGLPRRAAIVAGFLVLAATPALVFGTVAVAGSETGPDGAVVEPADTGSRAHTVHVRGPRLSDTQRQCMADQGVTLPERPADGSGERPAPLTEEQRAARREAAEACGIERAFCRRHGAQPGMI